MKLQNK